MLKGDEAVRRAVGAQSMGPGCGGAQGLPVVLPLNSPSTKAY